LGRATQGVTLIALDGGSKLSGLQRIAENDAEGEAVEGDEGPDGATGGAQPQA
jgi:DNA gyrase subunit A